MKSLISILCFGICTLNAFADAPEFMFTGGTHNDYGYDIKQTTDGGVIILGTTESYGAGGKDIFIIKKNIHGDTTWTKYFGGTGDEEGLSVVQMRDSSYGIAGYTTSYGNGNKDVIFLKVNANGTIAYYNTYGGTENEVARKIILLEDSSFVLTGYTESYGAGAKDVYVIKISKTGSTIWTYTKGTAEDDEAYSMLQNFKSELIIAATSKYNAGNLKNIFLINLSVNASHNWNTIIASDNNETPLDIQETYDRHYLLTGKSCAPASGNHNILLAKFDTTATTIFKTTYGGAQADVGNAVIPYFDMGYYVVGTSSSYSDHSEIYIMQVDEWGDSIQATHVSSGTADYASSAILTADSNIMIVGSSGNGEKAIDVSQLPYSLNCVGFYPRSILVGSLWAPAIDSVLNPGTPIEQFPEIMHSEFQKLRFANYLLHGHFHEIIIAVDSLFEEDEGGNNNSTMDGDSLRDSLSAFIVRLKTHYKVSRVIAWIQHTRDEKASMDTTNNMDIVRRLVKFNTDTSHHGKIDGMYCDYEFWEKYYGYNAQSGTAFHNIDTGYVRFKQLLNAMLAVRANPVNKLPLMYIYLADVYRKDDSLHTYLTDSLILNYVDSTANHANSSLYSPYKYITPYVNIALQFYITDFTDKNGCGTGNHPTRFIHNSNYEIYGRKLQLLGSNNYQTSIYPQYSAEDSIGTSTGKDNTYLGDWYQGGNYDAGNCFYNDPHYFYQADSIFTDQKVNSPKTPIGGWGSIKVKGFQIFKFDKISIDTLRARDSILYHNPFCYSSNNRIGHINAGNVNREKHEISILPNPFSDFSLLIFPRYGINKIDIKVYDVFGVDVSSKVNLEELINKSGEFKITNIDLNSGIYFATVKQENSSSTIKFIIIR